MLDVDYVTFKQLLLVMWITMEMGISGGRIHKEQGEVGQWQPNKLQSKGDHRRLEKTMLNIQPFFLLLQIPTNFCPKRILHKVQMDKFDWIPLNYSKS